MQLKRSALKARHLAGNVYNGLRSVANARQRRALFDDRMHALAALDRFSRDAEPLADTPVRTVLVDGQWDNPNYWTRYAFYRRALDLSKSREIGLLGQYQRRNVAASMRRLGIAPELDFAALSKPTAAHRAQAKEIIRDWTGPDDVMATTYPYDLPADIVFDGILKRQRRATVDVSDPLLIDHMSECLAYMEGAEKVLDSADFDLVLLSHVLDYTYASLAWAAIRRGIPVVALYGDYGTTRFIRFDTRESLFAYPSRPSADEIFGDNAEQRDSLIRAGRMYLDSRLSGRTGDISARFSYQLRNQMVSKQDLCRIFGWSEEKPIIAVYASNWFDFPHCGGLENFRDFYDWIALSMDVAARTTGVNWIFKAHPCDEWYGGTKGVTMEQMLERLDQPHVRLADTSWNGQALIKALDGIVTCHGTIGMEATYMGTPVLTAYSGWYRGGRFVREAESRQDYIDLLQSEWWQGLDREKNATNAALFAGWYFGVPAWHGDYLFEDDSEQDRIYARLPEFLTRFAPQIDKEVALLRAWHADGHPYSHIFKMLNAESHHYPSGGGQ